jgi:hypothetical protein
MSNKTSSEFNFLEAAMVKRTPIFEDCTNIVVGKGKSIERFIF